MRYKQYNNTDLKTSVVGIGTWPMSNIFWGKTEEKDCLATLNEALDCGINLIDTPLARRRPHGKAHRPGDEGTQPGGRGHLHQMRPLPEHGL